MNRETLQETLTPLSADEICSMIKQNDVKNVIFDLDDTLYRRWQPYAHAYETVFANRRTEDWPGGREVYMAGRKISDEEYLRKVNGEISEEQMHVNRTKRSFALFDIILSDAEALAFEEAYQAAQGQIKPVKSFLELLIWLKQHRADTFIGVMTNGGADRQWKKFHALGLEAYIPEEHVYISQAEGWDKPDVRAFRCYEKKFNLKSAETVLIGDSYETDVKGALAAGWQILYVQR